LTIFTNLIDYTLKKLFFNLQILVAFLLASGSAVPVEFKIVKPTNYKTSVVHEVPIKVPEVAEAELFHAVLLEKPIETKVEESKALSYEESKKDPRYNGEYGYHIPSIKNGVPLDTVSVQIARAEHLAVVAKAEKYEGKSEGKSDETEEFKGFKYAQAVFLDKDFDEKEPKLHNVYKRSADQYAEKKYDGKYGYHYTVIKNGVPVDSEAVQHATAAHLAAHAAEHSYGYQEADDNNDHYQHEEHHDEKYDGKYGYHYTVIKNGVPVDTEAVQHATAAHLAAHAAEHSYGYQEADYKNDDHYHHEEQHDQKYDGKYGYHYPIIKNGVPVDTEAVQHARAAHLAKVYGH
jgi:hypothetical protein